MKPRWSPFALELGRRVADRFLRSTCLLAHRIFLSGNGPDPRYARFEFRARQSRREMTLARERGTYAKVLLRMGYPRVARHVARRAYLHWVKARDARKRLSMTLRDAA